jgi:SAM-dependent methyltransferase
MPDHLPQDAATGALACPRCGGPLAGLACQGCGATYGEAFGVPFIGDFEAADALGLIEIAANARNRATLAVAPGTIERLDALCAGYHAAPDKDAFKAAHEEARAFYFMNRYHEWLAVETLLEGHDLTGKQVLDIGAGTGFDAGRLALRGARVTALEFSPILAEAGRKGFPDIRWFGGFAHALPFATGAFDYVFINAALHHMRDIPTSIAEALRVLRPGGTLITSGDPFRADAVGESLEYNVFDRHEGVLGGINEQIPRASDFFATLVANRAILAPELFTDTLHGGRSGSGPALTDWTRWDFDTEADLLRQRSGGLAMRVTLKAPWPHPPALQRDGALAPATFAAWLEEPDHVVARLARIVPAEVVDTPFPGAPAKIDLLNGWRVAQSTATTRTAFRRARLFRTRRAAPSMAFEMRAPTPATFTFLVNAHPVGTAEIGAQWTAVVFDVSAVPEGDVFLLEFRREGEAADFDATCFEVRLPGARAGLGERLRVLARRVRRRLRGG